MNLNALFFTFFLFSEHHTPKLHQFLKPGTKFTLEELFKIHESLKDFHDLVQNFQKDADVKDSQSLLDLTEFVLNKNVKLMGQIFALMLKAKANQEKVVELSKSDLDTLQKYLISPKEMYIQIIKN